MRARSHGAGAAEVVLPCPALEPASEFFAGLGFRVEAIWPADSPSAMVMSGHGLRLRLERGASGDPGTIALRMPGAAGEERIAPNGTRVIIAPLDPPVELPPLAPSLQISRLEDAAWIDGRAGMRYRDLIGDRYGGRFIASHIHIAAAGPVPDYVHYHRVALQLIVCARGWVRVVYQDQGPPFVLEAGDAVLQPPELRHRVLECSADLEVIELSAPAVHETRADHDRVLGGPARPGRRYGGQRFLHHRADAAAWRPWRLGGFEARDLGVGAATGGLARAEVARCRDAGVAPAPWSHGGELLFGFVLAGSAALETGDREVSLGAGDAFSLPAGLEAALLDPSGDLELLEIEVHSAALTAST